MSEEPTILYRLYDGTGDLLYVGITRNLSARWSQHRRDKPWWPSAVGKALVSYSTRAEAVAAEQRAIMVEGPRCNEVLEAQRVPMPSNISMDFWEFNALNLRRRETYMALASAALRYLEDGEDLDVVARSTGWSPRYVQKLWEQRRRKQKSHVKR